MKILLLVLSLYSLNLFAHSGRTDSSGCHGGRLGYHCHNSKKSMNIKNNVTIKKAKKTPIKKERNIKKNKLEPKWYTSISGGIALNVSEPKTSSDENISDKISDSNYVIETESNSKSESYTFSIARYYKKNTLSRGIIYQVMSFINNSYYKTEYYPKGSPNKETTVISEVKTQFTNYLLGFSFRNDLSHEQSAYLKLDLGYNWTVEDGGFIGNSSDVSLGSGLGFNVGLGFILNEKIDVSLYHANRSSNERASSIEDGLFIASFGFIF